MRWRKQERLLTSAALGIVYVSAGRQVLLEPLCLICHGLVPKLLEFWRISYL